MNHKRQLGAPGTGDVDNREPLVVVMWDNRGHLTHEALFQYHFELLSESDAPEAEVHILLCRTCLDVLEDLKLWHISLEDLEHFLLRGLSSPRGHRTQRHLHSCDPCRRITQAVRADIRRLRSSLGEL